MSLVIYKPSTRYFICFSYIGTRYWGVQRQVASQSLKRDNTIQSAIETAINSSIKPRPSNYPVSSSVSSRTDSLVHASENIMVCDLFHPVAGLTYDQDYVSDSTNEWLYKNDHLILIKKTVQVPRGYHIRRQAQEREYILRVLYHPNLREEYGPKIMYNIASFHDLNQVSLVQVPEHSTILDIEKVRRAIELMTGEHDFRSFEATPKNSKKERNSKETISKFTVTQVCIKNNSRIVSNLDPEPIFLDFVVKSGSYLYKQVRRMVGLSLTVGLGHATLDEVKYLLDNPSRDNWNDERFITAMPSGLYLRKIEFSGITWT